MPEMSEQTASPFTWSSPKDTIPESVKKIRLQPLRFCKYCTIFAQSFKQQHTQTQQGLKAMRQQEIDMHDVVRKLDFDAK